MAHEALAEAAAVLGAVGCAGVLVARGRLWLLAAFAVLAAAEASLAGALVPNVLRSLVDSPLRLGALVVGLVALVALAVPLLRRPAIVPVVLLVAAPF